MNVVEFVFRDEGEHVFSRFVPAENWKRAYDEYKVKAKGLGLDVYYFNVFNLQLISGKVS